MNMVHIAVDAVGGDRAPEEIVAGAIQGARDFAFRVSLVGDHDVIQYELSRSQTDDLQPGIIPAGAVIHMDENPANAGRSRSDASIKVACRKVTEGHADGVLTMGHKGAGLIADMSNFGGIPVPR
jgi:glycerol-3-phosphate acyltransferase PlsX